MWIVRLLDIDSSCAGILHMQVVIESWDGTSCHTLPTVFECNTIPNDASEIPTPEVAKLHSHLNSIANKIPPFVPDGNILLLIGRDLIDAHHVENQITDHKGHHSPRNLA